MRKPNLDDIIKGNLKKTGRVPNIGLPSLRRDNEYNPYFEMYGRLPSGQHAPFEVGVNAGIPIGNNSALSGYYNTLQFPDNPSRNGYGVNYNYVGGKGNRTQFGVGKSMDGQTMLNAKFQFDGGGTYLSDRAQATQFGQYAEGGSSWMLTNPNKISTFFPRMSVGGEGPADQKAWMVSYIQSPMYRERLKKEFAGKSDAFITKEISQRLNNVLNAKTNYVDSIGKEPGYISGLMIPKEYEGEIYNHKQQKFLPNKWAKDPYGRGMDVPGNLYLESEYTPKKWKPYPGFETTPLHEIGHAADDGGYRIPYSTKKKIYDYTNQRDPVPNYRSQGLEFDYYNTPTEFINRVQPIRYLLNKNKIYNANTQVFGEKEYNKMIQNSNIKSNVHFQDVMNSLKGTPEEKKAAFIDIMNSVAQNERPENEDMQYAKEGLTVTRTTTKAIPGGASELKDFMLNWNNSPMATQMLQASVDKDDPAGINSIYARKIRDQRNHLTSVSPMYVMGKEDLLKKYYGENTDKNRIERLGGFARRMETDYNRYRDFPNVLTNPGAFARYVANGGHDAYTIAGTYNPKNFKYEVNSKDFDGDRDALYQTWIHELSHAADYGGKFIPESDKKKMDKYAYGVGKWSPSRNKLSKFQDYVAEPTETRARLMNFRYNAKNQNLYDPFTQKVTKELLNKYKETDNPDYKDYDPLMQLREIYSDDQIVDLLNSVSKTEPMQARNPDMAKYGGLLSRTVRCSSCGHSWKAVDGGEDVMTCHNCGGMIKMQNGGMAHYGEGGDISIPELEQGGWLNKYGPGGQNTDGCLPGYDKQPTGFCLPSVTLTPTVRNLIHQAATQKTTTQTTTAVPSWKSVKMGQQNMTGNSGTTGVNNTAAKFKVSQEEKLRPAIEEYMKKYGVTYETARNTIKMSTMAQKNSQNAQLKQGHAETPAEKAYKLQQNQNYVNAHPNSAMLDANGNLVEKDIYYNIDGTLKPGAKNATAQRGLVNASKVGLGVAATVMTAGLAPEIAAGASYVNAGMNTSLVGGVGSQYGTGALTLNNISKVKGLYDGIKKLPGLGTDWANAFKDPTLHNFTNAGLNTLETGLDIIPGLGKTYKSIKTGMTTPYTAVTGINEGAKYLEKKIIDKTKSAVQSNAFKTAHQANDQYLGPKTDAADFYDQFTTDPTTGAMVRIDPNTNDATSGVAGRGPLYNNVSPFTYTPNQQTGPITPSIQPSQEYGGSFKRGGWMDKYATGGVTNVTTQAPSWNWNNSALNPMIFVNQEKPLESGWIVDRGTGQMHVVKNYKTGKTYNVLTGRGTENTHTSPQNTPEEKLSIDDRNTKPGYYLMLPNHEDVPVSYRERYPKMRSMWELVPGATTFPTRGADNNMTMYQTRTDEHANDFKNFKNSQEYIDYIKQYGTHGCIGTNCNNPNDWNEINQANPNSDTLRIYDSRTLEGQNYRKLYGLKNGGSTSGGWLDKHI